MIFEDELQQIIKKCEILQNLNLKKVLTKDLFVQKKTLKRLGSISPSTTKK